MTEERVVVVARVRANPGMEAKVKEELLRLVAPTRREEGCIQYDLHEHTESSGAFMFYEIWRSRQDLEDHMVTPHFKDFMEKAEDLLSQPGDLSLWKRIV